MPDPLHGIHAPHLCSFSRTPEVPSCAPSPGFLGSPVITLSWIPSVLGPPPGSPQFPAVTLVWGVPCPQSCPFSRTPPIPDCSPSLGCSVPFLGRLVSPSLRTPFHPFFIFQNSCESSSCIILCARVWEDGEPRVESLRCPHSHPWAEPAETGATPSPGCWGQEGQVGRMRDIGMPRGTPDMTAPLPQG